MKVCIALAVLIGLTGVNAYAERFPTQPIRMIIPFAAGGASDSLARIVARHLEKEVGSRRTWPGLEEYWQARRWRERNRTGIPCFSGP